MCHWGCRNTPKALTQRDVGSERFRCLLHDREGILLELRQKFKCWVTIFIAGFCWYLLHCKSKRREPCRTSRLIGWNKLWLLGCTSRNRPWLHYLCRHTSCTTLWWHPTLLTALFNPRCAGPTHILHQELVAPHSARRTHLRRRPGEHAGVVPLPLSSPQRTTDMYLPAQASSGSPRRWRESQRHECDAAPRDPPAKQPVMQQHCRRQRYSCTFAVLAVQAL
jgi:hypothetical protein